MSLEPQKLEDRNDDGENIAQPKPSSHSFIKAGRNIIIVIGILLLIAAGAVTSAYNVPAGHRGVVLRFGKFLCITDPGLHFRAPLGMDRVIDVDTDKAEIETFGFRSVNPGIGNKTIKDPESMKESLMLTGDLNMIAIEWTIEYKRQDPKKYLFSTHDPVQLVRDAGESVIRQIAGDRSFDYLLQNREELRRICHEDLQAALDRYDCGIKIVDVRLQNAGPPDAVMAAANEVNEARQEKERLINQALEAYNREIPRARGEARGTVNMAQGYALERVNKAKGEASRFSDVLKEYRKAKEVTKKRLYLETCREIIPKARNVIVIDSKQKNTLPLDLEKLGSSKGGET
jgi:modulator of FtsH protease HflK